MGKDKAKDADGKTPKERAAAERVERLRRQLRDNLQKRKAQSRARKATDTTDKL